MCGIVVASQIESSSKKLDELADKYLSLRGPDKKSIYRYENIEMRHYRLIVRGDANTGIQPCISSRYSMLFNGNITNTKELARNYNLRDSSSDTVLIFELYHKIGNRMFKELNGFFAIVILDKKNSEFILSRDRLGIKPLYYAKSKAGFCISSRADVTANIAQTKIKKDLMFKCLKYGGVTENNTIYENTEQVEPGTYTRFTIDGKQITKEQYWNLKDEVLEWIKKVLPTRI